MTSPTLCLLISAGLMAALLMAAQAQQVSLPCPFNSMCSCKMMRSVTLSTMAASSISHSNNHTTASTTMAEDDVPLDDAGDDPLEDAEALDERQEIQNADSVSDVSCVGVPFASLPVLPAGKITHVDIVSSGLEVADVLIKNLAAFGDLTPPSSPDARRTRIESLRLMSNRIKHVGDHFFSAMAHDLKSLDLSYNELDEIPARALRHLRVLDWANFHSNRIASLESLGRLWSHLSPTLHALFLGNNDITTLQRSSVKGRSWEESEHNSLSWLRHLNWLNVDGNQLSEISPESLPARLHTLSAAHNRMAAFPLRAVDHLRELRWLDLRGNYIRQLPVESFHRSVAGHHHHKLRLDKLDLGENLISQLPEGGWLFNRTLQVRDLYLDFNRISRLPDSSFRGTNAARLYLASNGLTSIDERAFHSLSSTLILLDLDRNRLQEYPRALEHLKRLRFLYLANNEIQRLDSDALATFGPHLEALSLAGNRLKQMPHAALRNCPKLIHLNLAYNSIDNVTADMFEEWASNLQVLLLKGNQLTSLPAGLLRHANQVRELSLSFNRLSKFSHESLADVADTLETLELNMALDQVDFPSALLKPLRTLHWLSLEHNQLTSLPTWALDHLNQLRYFSLEGNRLVAVNSSLFKGQRLRQLRDIRLAYNVIESVESRTFHNLPEVTTIVLSNNHIETIHAGAFDHLPKLITLNLAHNRISRMDAQAFRRLPNLIKIDLQSNRLKEFGWDVLVNSTNAFMAASLNLSDNQIAAVHSDTGGQSAGGNVHVKSLDLSRNHLVEFPSLFLAALAPHSLKKFISSHNRISSLDERLFRTSNCQGLQVLDLSRNHIDVIDKSAFVGADQLQVIDLSHNRLEGLASGLWANLTQLRIVNLSSNRIRLLSKDVFDRTSIDTLNLGHNHLNRFPVAALSSISSTLAYLDVSHNQIDHLDAVMLAAVPNLISLNLAHNRLTLLPDNVFSYLANLINLDLSHNTLRANFKELFHYMQRVKELNLANIGLTRWPHLPLPHLITLNLSMNALDSRLTVESSGSQVVLRLDRLRQLDLSRNRLTQVPHFLWPATPLLKQLDLSYNPIRTLNRDVFTGLSRLQTLILQPLPVLESIEPDSFHPLSYLTQLKIQAWPSPPMSQLLEGLHGLRRLSVEVRGPILASQLSHVATIQAAPKLREIEIFGPQLRSIQSEAFAHMGTHTLPECSLAIKQTLLRHLPERLINGLEGCAALTLDLRSNHLQTLTSQTIRNNNSLSVTSTRQLAGGLLLEHNPWSCSCENSWMGHWLKRWYLETSSLRHPVSPILPLSAATCIDPSTSTKKHLVDLPPADNSVCSVAALSGGSRSIYHQMSFWAWAAPVTLVLLVRF